MITLQQLGERIRQYRLEREWNENELGYRVGLSNASISRLEKGKQNISVYLLFDLAKELDVTLWQLIGDDGEEPPPWVLTPSMLHLVKAVRHLNDSAIQHLTAFVLTVHEQE
jgi:transcriptional regulator with XRE-family HTH domain